MEQAKVEFRTWAKATAYIESESGIMGYNLPTKDFYGLGFNKLSQFLFQDLTYQLIELERHFNALELNKFSQYGGRCIGHGPSQNRYGPSRYSNL